MLANVQLLAIRIVHAQRVLVKVVLAAKGLVALSARRLRLAPDRAPAAAAAAARAPGGHARVVAPAHELGALLHDADAPQYFPETPKHRHRQ